MNTVTRLMSAPFSFLLSGLHLILRDGRHNQYLLGVLNYIMNNQLGAPPRMNLTAVQPRVVVFRESVTEDSPA